MLRKIRNRIINGILLILATYGLAVLMSGCTGYVENTEENITEIITEDASEITSADGSSEDITDTGQKEDGAETVPVTDAEQDTENTENTGTSKDTPEGADYGWILSEIPAFDGTCAYVEINGNTPFFEKVSVSESFETYPEKDSLGRCVSVYACLGTDLMPTEERGEIGHVRPSGWHTEKYPEVIEGMYVYNRCHLIGFQLAGENDNTDNLITGTRFMNVDGMLPFENMVADYLHENTKNHVLYRVTPVYEGENLVASGVVMEALSVEDNGISFCVFCYNAQPGIKIDYKTGETEYTGENYETALLYGYSSVKGSVNTVTESPVTESTVTENTAAGETQGETAETGDNVTYIINTNTGKFHVPSCSSVDDMSEKNKSETDKSSEELINEGYSPCKRCIG